MLGSLQLLCWSVLLAAVSVESWVARHDLTSSQYQAELNKWTPLGYRLIYVSGYTIAGQPRFAAIFDVVSGSAWVSAYGLNAAAFQTTSDNYVKLGYRPILINGYNVGGTAYYVAIWDKSTVSAWSERHGMTLAAYSAEYQTRVSQNYRLVHFSVYPVGSQVLYASIFVRISGAAWTATTAVAASSFTTYMNSVVSQGYRPLLLGGYESSGVVYYNSLWDKSSGPYWYTRIGLSSAEYQGEVVNMMYQGYMPKVVSGYAVGSGSRYAAIWVNPQPLANPTYMNQEIAKYMTMYNVGGLSLAVAKNGRLIFAKGYGRANLATGEVMTPDHLLRIAGISMPITAVAIMLLVQQGKLQLSQRVFGSGNILGTMYGTMAYSSAVKLITVQHLLTHTSGWSNDGGDPMFMNLGYTQAQLIGWVLDNRAPKYTPGSHYELLNFGYCILGRIIEKITGLPYAAYVRANVLTPSGVTDMVIGGSYLTDRFPNEVMYYGNGVYSMNVPRMDANGGWLATPIDLVKFMLRVDGYSSVADILSTASIQTMFTGSSVNPSYGKGWILDSRYRGHNGGMQGTIGFLVSRYDGYTFAVLVNTRPGSDPNCFYLKAVIDDAVTSL